MVSIGQYSHGCLSQLQIISQEHRFLERNAIILRAATETLTDMDLERLRKYGIKHHALRANCHGDELVPSWLIKWSALILEFMVHEKNILPEALVEKARVMPELHLKYSEDNNLADIEAQGVFMNRLQNLMITLDKAKYFLRNQPQEQQVFVFLVTRLCMISFYTWILFDEITCVNPILVRFYAILDSFSYFRFCYGRMQYAPLRFLSDEEVLQHLWMGPESVVHEIRDTLQKYMKQRRYIGKLRVG